MELKQIILDHNYNYPRWQITDLVKLIYQNEFGCGHFVSDKKASLNRLKKEIGALPLNVGKDQIAFEALGNGFSRLHLSGKDDFSLETINQLFILSAQIQSGTEAGFEVKLELAKEMCTNKLLPFSLKELTSYLKEYKEKGYSPVSHSLEYKKAYLPSYRVISSVFAHYFPLLRQIERLVKEKERIVVAIDGPAGSGKSTLAHLLQGIYGCSVISMDHFFLQPEQRTLERLKEPGGNVDYERFQVEILPELKSEKPFKYRIYNCQTQSFTWSGPIKTSPLIIVEGSYSLHPQLRGSYDLQVFLTIDPKQQKERILKRNGSKMLERFLTEWIPLETKYFDAFEVEAKSHLIFAPYEQKNWLVRE